MTVSFSLFSDCFMKRKMEANEQVQPKKKKSRLQVPFMITPVKEVVGFSSVVLTFVNCSDILS